MRLHRLTLTNYRGISHRELEFAERGVTVVCGANEIGKSSMIEALDLLLESKDRSTKKDVKQVKPTHADVGSEVAADISTGPYRFVYRKRFHKKCETELTILSPAREQLTGDEAHERVRAMLDETVDTGLWQAQRVLQSASTSAVDLSGCDALSRALDVAASDSDTGLSGTEPLLIDKIDAEYARYFTATGRPTGEWQSAINAVQAAKADVDQCVAAVAMVEERVRAHAIFTDELAVLAGQHGTVSTRLTTAEAAAAAVTALTHGLCSAKTASDAAAATSTAATAAQQERVRLRADFETRQAAVSAAAQAVTVAEESEVLGRDVVAAANDAAAAAAKALQDAQARVVAARRVVAHLADRDEADRLASRLDRIDATQRELDAVNEQLPAIMLSDKLFRQIQSAATAVEMARAQADLTAATIEFTAESDIELVVDDRRIALTAGQTWCLTAAEATAVRLPGVLRVQVSPGATAVDTHAKLTAAQHNLAELLVSGGVADIDEAKLVDQRRRELTAHRDQLGATLAGVRGDDDIDALRARLATLRADAGDTDVDIDTDIDIAAARTQLKAGEADLAQRSAQCDTQRKVAAAAATQLVERTTGTTLSRQRVATAQNELEAVAARLAEGQALICDDDLATRATVASGAASQARDLVTTMTVQLGESAPESVAAEFTAASAAARDLNARRDDVARKLHDVTVELAVFGTEGRTGKLDAAQIAHEHAVAAHARIQSRARAVQLLRSVMVRHRDNTRLRYVEPFRAEIQRLGSTVFGPTFEVEVDSDLQIRNRTLDGRTVPFESLSGGAKEQLGIVARLAVAALVANEDTVPVVIDDALGFSDPERLAKMGAVFDQVGADGQVIVLTCSPERYSGVRNAHRVDLSA